MVDEQDDSPLTPEQDAAVRRLVAEARHDEPIPENVAARLDKVLDHLATEAAAPAGRAPVVDLDSRRRRRLAGRLLVAAAAVVIGGIAIGQVLGDSSLLQSGDDAGSAADTDAGAERGSNLTGSDAPAEGAGGSESGEDESSDPANAPEAATDGNASAYRLGDYVPVTLTSGSFDEDVRRVYRKARLARTTIANKSLMNQAQPFDCPDAAYGDGLLVPAYYDGQPSVLAFRPPVGSHRVAELLECGTADSLGSLSLTFRAGR